MLTPYAAITLGDGGHRTVRAGARSLLGLGATHQCDDNGAPSEDIRLQVTLCF